MYNTMREAAKKVDITRMVARTGLPWKLGEEKSGGDSMPGQKHEGSGHGKNARAGSTGGVAR